MMREVPHEQLCSKMRVTNVQQFRYALYGLHIAQSRNHMYHGNSSSRIIDCCIQKHCLFYMVAFEIKYEKTFLIRKMRLDHTCGATKCNPRVGTKWLAKT